MLHIVDYGMGNLRSVAQALRAVAPLADVQISGDADAIRHADRILLMHEGSLAEQGTHEELMALQGRYYALFRQQEASAA